MSSELRFGSLVGLSLSFILAGCATKPPEVAPSTEIATTKVDHVSIGGELYGNYCVNCHGEYGTGDGAFSSLLKIDTPDITRISARNDGVFPREKVREKIDGTAEVAAHGSRAMPVWGVVLDPSRGTGDERDRQVAQQQIESLLHYVESIQLAQDW